MSSYTRGKKKDRAAIMEALISSAQLTPAGADWLTLRLDPYHDFNRPIAGYPDADTYNTIVSANNYEYNITAPAGAAGNWDAHIFTMPFDTLTGHLGNVVNGVFTQTATNYSLGLVNIAKDDAEGPLFPTAVPVASANFSMTSLDSTFSGFAGGQSRIIGMGIEVIDTTAVLNKQGSLLAYKMPSTSGTCDYAWGNTAATQLFQIQNSRVLQRPPATAAEAILYKDTVQWEARDGCYMAVGQEGINNPFTIVGRPHYLITPDPEVVGTDVSITTGCTLAAAAPNAPPLLSPQTCSSASKAANLTQSGIIIKGLHNDATLKVRVRIYVERAPMRGESDLIVLATPSAAYDYKALALYSVLAHELPIAVPVGFNAKGDWWRMIVDAVTKLAPVLGAILTPIFPAAGAIGTGIGQVAGVVQQITKKKPQKKPPLKQIKN